LITFDSRYKVVAYLKSIERKKYYCYMLSHNDVPFYVGVSKSNTRLYSHEKEAEPFAKVTNALKSRKIRKIKREGGTIQYTIVNFFSGDIEIQHAERALILQYGRKIDNTGILTNIQEGGEGSTNRRQSKKQIAAAILANTGRPKSAETIERLKASIKTSYEQGRKGSFTGKTHTEEWSAKMSEIQKERYKKKPALRGPESPNYGQVRTEQQKLNIKNGRPDSPCSDERKQKLKDFWNSQPVLTCPHCGKESTFKPAMVAYHFDNCKVLKEKVACT